MARQPKTIDELRSDIRMTGNAIDAHWPKAMPLLGPVDLESLRFLESNANALAIYCKLLRQLLEAQDPAIQHLRATLAEGE
jgi:hypothetical protein